MISLGLLLVLAAIAGLIFIAGLKKIPEGKTKEEPLQFGIITWLGRPTEETREAGWTWLMPGIQNIILKNATVRTIEIIVEDAYSKDGAFLGAKVRLSYIPDRKRILWFLRAGDEEKIKERLTGIVRDAVRQYFNTHSAKKALRSPDEVRTHIVRRITEMPEDEALNKIQSGGDDEGVPDIEGMGTIITRLNIESVFPTGDTKRALEAAAQEKYWRPARKERAKTFTQTVDEKHKALKGLPPTERQKREKEYEEERELDLIERGRGQIIKAPGGANVIVDGRQSRSSGAKGKGKDSDERSSS